MHMGGWGISTFQWLFTEWKSDHFWLRYGQKNPLTHVVVPCEKKNRGCLYWRICGIFKTSPFPLQWYSLRQNIFMMWTTLVDLPVRGPLVSLWVGFVRLCEDLHFLSHHERWVETNTKLTDNILINVSSISNFLQECLKSWPFLITSTATLNRNFVMT